MPELIYLTNIDADGNPRLLQPDYFGRKPDGSEIDFDAMDAAIGTETAEGWWVKGRSADGGLLLSRGKGYRVENRVVEESSDKS